MRRCLQRNQPRKPRPSRSVSSLSRSSSGLFAFGRGTLGRRPPFCPQTRNGGQVMAIRTQSRSSSSTRSGTRNSSRSGNGKSRTQDRTSDNRGSSNDRSAFSWGDNAGPLLGAALAGAAIVVGGDALHIQPVATTIAGGVACFLLRYMAIRHGWHLPSARPSERGQP